MAYGDHIPAAREPEEAAKSVENSKTPLLTPFQLGPFKLQHRYVHESGKSQFEYFCCSLLRDCMRS
jgi:hypothetical protein